MAQAAANLFFHPRLRLFGLPAISIFLIFSLLPGCANIQSPMGGPKDTIPPVLIKATPENDQLNFKGSVIRFEFSEYIKLENLNENLIINPPQDKYPIILSKLRNLSLKIMDTLQPNTTYTLNFGNAVADVNEGNVFKNFSYAFSTGPYIDSLELFGKVTNAETGIADSTLTIILHTKSDDSTVAKEKPRFVTRPNGKGVFHFDHLPDGKFFIYALKDEGPKRYTSNQLLFAFNNEQVAAGFNDSIRLRAFVGEQEPQKKAGTASSGKNDKNKKEEKKFGFTVSVRNSAQDLLSPLTITFPLPVKEIDSSRIRLTDTLFNPIAGYNFKRDTAAKEISLVFPWKETESYQLILDKEFATDSAGLTNSKPDTISFKTKAETEYGSLKLILNGVDLDRHPVLQFVENDKVTKHFALSSRTFSVKLFTPGQYKLRILYDANQNGIWDTGNYWTKIQPEFIVPVTEVISVKPNWDNEVEINL